MGTSLCSFAWETSRAASSAMLESRVHEAEWRSGKKTRGVFACIARMACRWGRVRSGQVQCVEQEQAPGEGGMSSKPGLLWALPQGRRDTGQQRLGPLTDPARLVKPPHGFRLAQRAQGHNIHTALITPSGGIALWWVKMETSTEEINTKTGKRMDGHTYRWTDGEGGRGLMGRQQTKKKGICAAALQNKETNQ